MSKYRQVAIKAAKLAGKSLIKNYKKLRVSEIKKKGPHDLVTKADFEANDIIIKIIKKSFPDHDILSEETGLEDNPSEYTWTIDPLDGTVNYYISSPLFCTAISLMYKKEILLSIIYAPVLNEFYIAEKGKGAYLNNKRIRVKKNEKIKDSVLVLGRTHNNKSRENFLKLYKKFQYRFLNLRNLGSGSLDLAFVASGRVEACLLVPPDLKLWDISPGILLVREAGGVVTDFNKGDKYNSQGVIAANKKLHPKLIKVL